MPAQAGIQGVRLRCSGRESWIPAFAGMTMYGRTK